MEKLIYKYLALAYGQYFNSLALISKRKAAEKAFNLFCSPRKGKVLPHQQEYLNAAKDQVLQMDSINIQTYQWSGSKETVLLLHGWESNVYRWKNLIEKLQEAQFNIIAIDAPGHGNSSGNMLNVPLYTECTNVVISTYNPSFVIGHSMGGMTTIYNQYKYPNPDIKKLVSLGSPSELSELMDHYQNLLSFNDVVLSELERYIYERYEVEVHEFSAAKFSQKIDKEGFIVHDELDTIAPFSAAERIHGQWKKSSLLKTSGLGHSLHQEEVNQKIIDFLNS
ncbi:alpha/beta hydrolase [Sediminicola sp. 1XM1-17]|uniref:alpha/beta hydrolase n=1 Tax=Sediminicola sp. 1XM1-17 TaxID=3127702 RepID=UPI00307807BD